MAGKSYQQTGTSRGDAEAGCSGATPGSSTRKEIQEGGAPGTSAGSLSAAGGDANSIIASYWTPTGGTGFATWAAGDFVVRLNVTTANMNLTWHSTYICERTSGGGTNAVASLTGQSVSLGSTGVVSMTVNLASDYAAATTSLLMVQCVVGNGGMFFEGMNILDDQLIDTPIGAAGAYSSFALQPKWPAAIREWVKPAIGRILRRPLIVVPAWIR